MNFKESNLLKQQLSNQGLWNNLAVFKIFCFGCLLGALLMAPLAMADQLVHKFKSPSFSGQGTGAHYLTIENQEKSRRDKIREDIESALKAKEREEENSTINKFIRNLESRIYAQISKGLVDSMFCDPKTVATCTGSDSGSFSIEQNNVTYQKVINDDGLEVIRLTIVGPDGSTTEIEIPIGLGNIGG